MHRNRATHRMPHKHRGRRLSPSLLLLLWQLRRTAGSDHAATIASLAAKHVLPQGHHISSQRGSRKISPIQRLRQTMRPQVGCNHPAPAD